MAGHLAAQECAVPHAEWGQHLILDGGLERRAGGPGQQQSEKLEPALE